MRVKVDMDVAKLKRLSTAQYKALKATSEQLLHEAITAQVMPLDTANLQNVATYIDTKEARSGNVVIATDTPYARRLYYHPEYNFRKTFNANAQGEWWEPWITGNLKGRAAKIYKILLRKFTKGVVK